MKHKEYTISAETLGDIFETLHEVISRTLSKHHYDIAIKLDKQLKKEIEEQDNER